MPEKTKSMGKYLHVYVKVGFVKIIWILVNAFFPTFSPAKQMPYPSYLEFAN